MRLDWKFILTLLTALAGVAVPVWLWQTDHSSKSLSVKLATRIALQPKEQEHISGMEISVDGARLVSPHLVVLEIRNDGNKPIPAADFESPVHIQLESETSFARANVTSRIPKDIEATLVNAPKAIYLKPTLLNPGDNVSITAVTSGAPPAFSVKARVVGISSVTFDDSTANAPNKIKLALLLIGAILSFIGYSLMGDVVINPTKVRLRRRSAAVVGLVTAFAGVLAALAFLEEIGVQGPWHFVLYGIALMVPAGLMASILNRPEKSDAVDTSGK